MTSAEGIESVIADIRGRPHWEVRVVPPDLSRRIEGALECKTVAQAATVRLRGWDFPHLEDMNRFGKSYPIAGGYESWTRYRETEAWRLTQSGQFVYLSTLSEDDHPDDWRRDVGSAASNGPFLSFESSVYIFTEVAEFAARLTDAVDYGRAFELAVTLHGAKQRRLVAGLRRSLFRDYVCEIDDIDITRTLEPSNLRAERKSIAVEMVAELFQMFSFVTEERVLLEVQQGLYDRTLR